MVKKRSTYKKDKGIKTGWNIQYLGKKKMNININRHFLNKVFFFFSKFISEFVGFFSLEMAQRAMILKSRRAGRLATK